MLDQRMSPLGAYVTIAESIAFTSLNSLTPWGRGDFVVVVVVVVVVFFSPSPVLFFSSQESRGLFCIFASECPHVYWGSKRFNFVPCKLIIISKHYFIKAALGLCS